MKKITLLSLAATFGLATFFSCNKKFDTTESSSKQTNLSTINSTFSYTWSDAENSANPYDSIGLLHNKCLYSILLVNKDSLLSVENIYSAAYDFLEEEYGIMNADDFSTLYYENSFGDFGLNLEESNYDFQNLVSGLNTSSKVKVEISALVSLVSDTGSYDLSDYFELKNRIVDWETNISSMGSGYFTNEEEALLLSTSAILRYSYLGWSDGSFASTGCAAGAQLEAKWWKIAIGDGLGGLVGGLLSVGNPVFIGVGAAIGSGGVAIF